MSDPLYLSASDINALPVNVPAMVAQVERGLTLQARGEAIAQPTVGFSPLQDQKNLISLVHGSLPIESRALVKVVGTFPDNPEPLPTNPGMTLLLDAANGVVSGMLDGGRLTTWRTALVNAIAINYLAPSDARVVGCIGSRGIAWQTMKLLSEMRGLDHIRLHSPNAASCQLMAERLEAQTGVKVTATSNWADCLDGADILVEGASLKVDQPCFPLETFKPGCVMVLYGVRSSLPLSITDQIERLIVDRWVPEGGALGPHLRQGLISEHTVDNYLGELLGEARGIPTNGSHRTVFWQRGVAACDILLAEYWLKLALTHGLGQTLRF